MDVKSSHEKPTWHGGEFYPELIRKSMFFLFAHRNGAQYADRISSLSACLRRFHECFFFLFNCECLFGLLFCGYSLARWPWEKIKPGFSLSKLTVGHRGGEEESPEASPRFVTVGQLCVSETRVNRAVWSHKAALIKGVYLGLLPQFLTSSLLLLCPARLPGRLTGRATGLTRNRGRPTKRKQI